MSSKLFAVTGKNVLVTGGSRGIGVSIEFVINISGQSKMIIILTCYYLLTVLGMV